MYARIFLITMTFCVLFGSLSAQSWSIACPDDPLTGTQNPAYFGTIQSSAFQSIIQRKNIGRYFVEDMGDYGELVYYRLKFSNLFSNRFIPFGFDMYGYETPVGRETNFYSLWWGLSLGSKSGGIGYMGTHYFYEDKKKYGWSLGLLSRMARWLSWGLTYSEKPRIDSYYGWGYMYDSVFVHLGEDEVAELRTGLAIRPYKEFITLWADAIFHNDLEYKSAMVGGEIMPVDGVHLRGSYHIENEQIEFGLRLDMGHFSGIVSAQSSDDYYGGIMLSSRRLPSLSPYRKKSIRLTIEGSYPESPSLLGGKCFRKLSDAIATIIQDGNVEQLIIKLENPSFSFAQYEELRSLLTEFKNRGGKIKIFAEHLGNGTMYLTSIADQICLSPAGGVNFFGIGVEITYFRGLLDKLGITPDMVHIGKYKTAAEQYTADTMSPEMRKELTAILTHIDTIIITEIAISRGISVDEVRGWTEKCPLHSKNAMDEGIIDTVAYWDEFMEFSGWNKSVSANKYLSEHNEVSHRWDKSPEIAIIPVEGSIVRGLSNPGGFLTGKVAGEKTTVKMIESASRDENIKGIILRIDSPGGSAYASDIIWRAAKKAAQKKPVWVSMAGYAASGGYYIASAGDSIFADLSTITGSIGVIGGKFSIAGLYDKLGLNTQSIYLSKNANIYSLTDTFSTQQRKMVKRNMESSYQLFKNRILQGRKNLTPDSLESLAQGKTYTGISAKQCGLVDEIAGITDIHKLMAEKLEISQDYKIHHYSPYKMFDWLELLRKLSYLSQFTKISRDMELLTTNSEENLWYIVPYYLKLK
ncbi:signal peptide peptidase SppA [bacterium]|nr:MAG: signal peptide peptidase SppA [bacterium]